MNMKSLRRVVGSGFLLFGVVLLQPLSSASAIPADVPLGTAGAFSVLAGSTVTNTGPSVISGDAGNGGNLGVSPGSAVTGFPPGLVTPPGTIHTTDAVAGNAQSDLTIAYNTAAGLPCNKTLTDQDLGGQTLTSGVYCFATSAQLTGTLTLDAEGNPDAVFIFQIGSTLITASNSTVAFVNGAQGCHVFWQVGSSATLGTSSLFSGTIMALTSITANTTANVQGRLLARNGAVTLDSNAIHTPACAPETGVPTAPLFGAAGQGVAVGMFLAGAGLIMFRRRSLLAPTAL
ncbi:MAG: ice-binding family protein [Ornithinibacter sp.]